MESLYPDVIRMIGQKLNLRSLVKFSSTCKFYRQVLSPFIFALKEELFTPAKFVTGDGDVCCFYPGPAIKKFLSSDMPINGVYFLDTLLPNCQAVNFFCSELCFERYLSNNLNLEPCNIASIDTDDNNVYKNDIGCYQLDDSSRFWHWNDLDCDYRDFFAFGKSKITEFWKQY